MILAALAILCFDCLQALHAVPIVLSDGLFHHDICQGGSEYHHHKATTRGLLSAESQLTSKTPAHCFAAAEVKSVFDAGFDQSA